MPDAGLELLRPMLRGGIELGSSGGQTGVETLLVEDMIKINHGND